VSDEDATRMLATFRPPRHVKMVRRVADMSATSRARGIRRDTRDIPVTSYEDVARVGRVYGDVTKMLRHEETATMEFGL